MENLKYPNILEVRNIFKNIKEALKRAEVNGESLYARMRDSKTGLIKIHTKREATEYQGVSDQADESLKSDFQLIDINQMPMKEVIRVYDDPLEIDVGDLPIYRLIKVLELENPVWSEQSELFHECYLTAIASTTSSPENQILMPLYQALKETIEDSDFDFVSIREAMESFGSDDTDTV